MSIMELHHLTSVINTKVNTCHKSVKKVEQRNEQIYNAKGLILDSLKLLRKDIEMQREQVTMIAGITQGLMTPHRLHDSDKIFIEDILESYRSYRGDTGGALPRTPDSSR